jgi:large subunit ribosomal protein L22
MSPTKARQVVDMIRGRHIEDARRVLAFTQRAASAPVVKILNSAIANAEHNHELPSDELVVKRAWVDEGPTLKRFRPRALGRATRIRKRTCHISVVVGRDEEALQALYEPPAPKKTTRKKTTAKKTTAKKTTAKKTTAKKTTAKKTTAKKTTAKKTTAKKTTAKKTTAKKTTRKKSEGEGKA